MLELHLQINTAFLFRRGVQTLNCKINGSYSMTRTALNTKTKLSFFSKIWVGKIVFHHLSWPINTLKACLESNLKSGNPWFPFLTELSITVRRGSNLCFAWAIVPCLHHWFREWRLGRTLIQAVLFSWCESEVLHDAGCLYLEIEYVFATTGQILLPPSSGFNISSQPNYCSLLLSSCLCTECLSISLKKVNQKNSKEYATFLTPAW